MNEKVTKFSVPQNVGKWINDLKFWEKSLGDAFDQVYEVRPGLSDVYDWIRANSETFANAWLYGFDEEA